MQRAGSGRGASLPVTAQLSIAKTLGARDPAAEHAVGARSSYRAGQSSGRRWLVVGRWGSFEQ
jgi:hypothetical protein